MSKDKKSTINVQGTAATILSQREDDFISLTDMLKVNDGDFFISDWLRNRNTVEFLGIWERVHNLGFNLGEFATIKFATYFIACYAISTRAAGRFGIIECRRRRFAPSWACAWNVGAK